MSNLFQISVQPERTGLVDGGNKVSGVRIRVPELIGNDVFGPSDTCDLQVQLWFNSDFFLQLGMMGERNSDRA